MPAKFDLKKAKNGKHYFNLCATNGEVILTSQMYASKAGAKKGIASVQSNAADNTCFKRCKGKKGKSFFVLRACNHRVIGTSQMYSSAAAMEKGMKAVKKSGKSSRIVEVN